MGAYLNTPIREKDSVDNENQRLRYGASSMQGWRMSQEDAHNCCPDFDPERKSALFAVYDGHGGSEVAQYAAANLPKFLLSHKLYKDSELGEALTEIFIEFDELLTQDGVIEELKKLAGVEEQPRNEDSDDEETEAAMLFEEADMPIEKLMERYGGSTGPPKAGEMRTWRKTAIVQSPAIKPKEPGQQLANSTQGEQDKDDVKLSLEQKLINGCDSQKSENGSQSNSDSKDTQPCSSEVFLEEKAEGDVTAKPDVSSSTVNSASASNTTDSSSDGVSSTADVSKSASHSADRTGGSSCSSSSEIGGGVGSSAGNTGDDAQVSSSDGASADTQGGSSSAGPAGTEDGPAGSSTGKTRKSRKNIIPCEGEDESSFDEDEEDTEEEEDSEDEGVTWSSDDDDSEDDEVEMDGFPPKFSEDGQDDDEEEEGMEEFMGGGEEPGSDSGCTAVLALLQGRELFVANAGDSRCVVCRDGKAIDMSFDHKPEDTVELDRITKAGGKVTPDGRVNGGLNLSRALGDHCYKQNKALPLREQMISALPDIKSISIEEADEFMVLACDGIWNVMSSQDVVSFVRDRIKAGATKLSSICEEMFEFCLSPDTMGDGTGCDNMTCIIVAFDKLHQLNNGSSEVVAAVKKRRADSSGADSEGWELPDAKRTKVEDSENSKDSDVSKDNSTDPFISTTSEDCNGS